MVPDYRLAAAALVVAIVMTVPGQSDGILGVELVVIAIVAGAAMLVLNNRAHQVPHADAMARMLGRVGPNATTIALIGTAGALTIGGARWGIYLLVPAELAALVGGMLGAWLFLTKTSESAEPRR